MGVLDSIKRRFGGDVGSEPSRYQCSACQTIFEETEADRETLVCPECSDRNVRAHPA